MIYCSMTTKQSISELHLLSETDKMIRINERLEEYHASNYDWNRVIKDKWNIAKLSQRGI